MTRGPSFRQELFLTLWGVIFAALLLQPWQMVPVILVSAWLLGRRPKLLQAPQDRNLRLREAVARLAATGGVTQRYTKEET